MPNHQTFPASPPRPEHLLGHISVPRWSTYLTAAHSDPARALELYEWNLTASAATHTVLSIVEIALRNTMDRSLRAWNPTQGQGHMDEWTITPCSLIRKLTRDGEDLDSARSRAENAVGKRRTPNHDDIVAHLAFGTWRYLLPTSSANNERAVLFSQAFGAQAPTQAFPHWTWAPHMLGREVADLHRLRNRIAHHEPLMNSNLAGRLETARRVLGAIDPALASWLNILEQLTAANASRPS